MEWHQRNKPNWRGNAKGAHERRQAEEPEVVIERARKLSKWELEPLYYQQPRRNLKTSPA